MRSRAGLVTEILVFASKISVTGMEIFLYEHSSLNNQDKIAEVPFATQWPKWHNFCLVHKFTLKEYALSVKLQQSTKQRLSLTIQIYVPVPFWLCFSDFIPANGAEISHMDKPKNSSSNQTGPVTGLI